MHLKIGESLFKKEIPNLKKPLFLGSMLFLRGGGVYLYLLEMICGILIQQSSGKAQLLNGTKFPCIKKQQIVETMIFSSIRKKPVHLGDHHLA